MRGLAQRAVRARQPSAVVSWRDMGKASLFLTKIDDSSEGPKAAGTGEAEQAIRRGSDYAQGCNPIAKTVSASLDTDRLPGWRTHLAGHGELQRPADCARVGPCGTCNGERRKWVRDKPVSY